MRRTLALMALLAAAPFLSGFDLSNSRVPAGEILSGGPPKDGIPAILRPNLVAAEEGGFLDDDDRVVGIAVGGEARAYPLRILTWHEAVNDAVGERAIAVTYCPLTASAVVFDREVDGRTLTFGISGRLFQSNVLLYDHQSDSLWSQLAGEAVSGPRAAAALRPIAAVETSWKVWRTAHPETSVLSADTGFARDYERNPYAAYHRAPGAMFETRHADARLPMKAKVFGLEVASHSAAYPIEALAEAEQVEDEVGGVPVRIVHDRDGGAASAVRVDTGDALPGVVAYWFAWTAFHPETRLWRGAARASRRDAPVGEARGNEDVAVTSHTAYWADIPMPAVETAGDPAPGLLVIRGELANRSGRELHHVRIRYELLDRDGAVVESQQGFNLGGEVLTPVSGVEVASGSAAKVVPLPEDGTDAFRMLLPADELPAFARYRVRVLEAGLGSPRD